MKHPSLPGAIPEAPLTSPGAILPLFSVCILELRKDFSDLIESRWSEDPRRRARELASTLAEACGRQRLTGLAKLSRSMVCLVELSRPEALPLLGSLRKKLEELVKSAEGELLVLTRSRSA